MHRRKFLTTAAAGAAALLAACTPTPTPQATPVASTPTTAPEATWTPEPTATAVPPAPTATAVPAPTATPTPFLYPCAPQEPSEEPPTGTLRFGALVGRSAPPVPRSPSSNVVPLPTPPIAWSNSSRVAYWPMYSNDRYGDCTVAAAAHMIESWQSLTQSCMLPTNTEVVNDYFQITNGQDIGAVLLDVLQYWKSHGIQGDHILDFAQVNPTHLTQVCQAIWLYGGLYVAFPVDVDTINAFNQGRPWDAGRQLTGDGHCVPIVDFDTNGVTVVTWGGLQRATWAWVTRNVSEAWAVLPSEAHSALFGDFNRLSAALQLLST